MLKLIFLAIWSASATGGGSGVCVGPVDDDIFSKYNFLGDDQQLIQFYREILAKRERLERLEGEEGDLGEAPLVVEYSLHCTLLLFHY